MTATANTHITLRFSIGSSISRGVSGSNMTDSDADIGTRSLSPAPLMLPLPFCVTLSI